jgi:glycerol-3-phosphate dehydrogenase (NAD(P)+)
LLHKNLQATRDLGLVKEADVIVIALPSDVVRGFLEANLDFFRRASGQMFLILTKGFDPSTGLNQADLIERYVPGTVAILSGGSFAKQVLECKKTCVTLACDNKPSLEVLANSLENGFFRVQKTSDTLGVSLMGLVKNPIAIGMGILSGIGAGENEKSYFLSRSMEDVLSLSHKIGGKPETLGLASGFGDIFLSCVGDSSRNFKYGLQVASNYPNFTSLSETVEGVKSLKILHNFYNSARLFNALYEIVFEGKNPSSLLNV